MEIIDLEHKLTNSDVSKLVQRIGTGPLRIINHIYSDVICDYERGVIRFGRESVPEYHHSGIGVWIPLLKSPNITGVFLNHLDANYVENLPLNIRTLFVEDLEDLVRVERWLTGDIVNSSHKNMTVKYVGNHSTMTPKMKVVSPSISHLLLPFGKEVSEIVRENPHIVAIGVDLDKAHHTDVGISTMIWSSNSHRINHRYSSSRDIIIGAILYSK